jgi:hypothetical protein
VAIEALGRPGCAWRPAAAVSIDRWPGLLQTGAVGSRRRRQQSFACKGLSPLPANEPPISTGTYR